jgi:hypothetical protein
VTPALGVRHNQAMPRANRRRRDEAPLNHGRALGGAARREQHAGGEWFVRAVTGAGATRAYLCPGCSQDVRPGVPHVVVWPADGVGGLDQRRHWHSACWGARTRRPPRGSWK